MPRRSRKAQKSHTKLQELVTVFLADDIEQAKEFETLLKSNDIPAMVRHRHDESGLEMRFAVLVPEESADEAHVIIESQDTYDDLYDFDLEEQGEESEFDDDVFDDNY
jgi:hypothetical protein